MFSYVWLLTKNLNVDTLTSLTNTVCKLLDLFVWIFLYPMSCDQFSYLDCAQGWSLQNETKWPSWSSPLHLNISMYFLHTVRRILRCRHGEFVQQSRASLVGDHFLYSHDLKCLIQGWYCKEKLDASHS